MGGDSSRNQEPDSNYLPVANIARIMKKALPSDAKISKDAKEAIQECVTEFIGFITSEYVLIQSLWTNIHENHN